MRTSHLLQALWCIVLAFVLVPVTVCAEDELLITAMWCNNQDGEESGYCDLAIEYEVGNLSVVVLTLEYTNAEIYCVKKFKVDCPKQRLSDEVLNIDLSVETNTRGEIVEAYLGKYVFHNNVSIDEQYTFYLETPDGSMRSRAISYKQCYRENLEEYLRIFYDGYKAHITFCNHSYGVPIDLYRINGEGNVEIIAQELDLWGYIDENVKPGETYTYYTVSRLNAKQEFVSAPCVFSIPK